VVPHRVTETGLAGDLLDRAVGALRHRAIGRSAPRRTSPSGPRESERACGVGRPAHRAGPSLRPRVASRSRGPPSWRLRRSGCATTAHSCHSTRDRSGLGRSRGVERRACAVCLTAQSRSRPRVFGAAPTLTIHLRPSAELQADDCTSSATNPRDRLSGAIAFSPACSHERARARPPGRAAPR
jgi:hypothetical protein